MYTQKIVIKYDKEFIPKGCRKPRYEEVTEEHEIPIREYQPEDLKKVLRIEYVDKYDIYSCEGELWRLALESDLRVPKDRDNMVDPLPLFLDRTKYSTYYGKYCGLDRSTRESKTVILKRAMQNNSKYMIVSNKLYIAISEPYYYIQTFGCGNNHGGTSLMIAFDNPSKYIISRAYTALEWEKAINRAISIASRRGDTNDVKRYMEAKKNNTRNIIVYDKNAIKLDFSDYEVGFTKLDDDEKSYLIHKLAEIWAKKIVESGVKPKPKTNLMKAYKSWKDKHLTYTDDLAEYIVAYCYNQLVDVLKKEKYYPDGSKVTERI